MAQDPKNPMPSEMANAINLLAHPVAMSAFGLGMAGHAFGVWMGAMQGVADVSQQLLYPPQVEEKEASAPVAATPAASAPGPAAQARQSNGLRPPAGIDRPAVPDDLKAISGVGPKLEQVLNGLGVWTYAQIAVWTREEIDWVEGHLGIEGRIGRDEWLRRAAEAGAQR